MGCPMFSVVGTVTMGFLVFLGTQLVTLVCTRVLSDVCGRAPVAQFCRKHKMRRCCNYYISLLQHCNKFPAIWIHSFFSCLCFLCVFFWCNNKFSFPHLQSIYCCSSGVSGSDFACRSRYSPNISSIVSACHCNCKVNCHCNCQCYCHCHCHRNCLHHCKTVKQVLTRNVKR